MSAASGSHVEFRDQMFDMIVKREAHYTHFSEDVSGHVLFRTRWRARRWVFNSLQVLHDFSCGQTQHSQISIPILTVFRLML